MPQSERRREYMRRYMRRRRREERREKRARLSSKGGDYRGGLGRGGEQESVNFSVNNMLASEPGIYSLLAPIYERLKMLEERTLQNEATIALQDAILKQVEEWSG